MPNCALKPGKLNKKLLILFLGLISSVAQASQKGICDFIDLPSCHGISKVSRRSSSQSYPSSSTSALNNPATVSHDRGIGAELLFQPRNPVGFSVVTGTGRMGGAIISPSLENSFFGNRVIELPPEFLERQEDEQRYDSRKLNLALGAALIKEKNYSVDLGLLFKRHSIIKDINMGAGLSARLGPLSLGGSFYRDDLNLRLNKFIDPATGQSYATLAGKDYYREKFNVQNLSAGLRIGRLALDAGLISTRYKFYDDDTKILLYSAAYSYRNFMFHLALRKEESPDFKYEDGILVEERIKNETYTGVQASIGKRLILGLHYNYFLLREASVTATIFFK